MIEKPRKEYLLSGNTAQALGVLGVVTRPADDHQLQVEARHAVRLDQLMKGLLRDKPADCENERHA